jgi:hypothetical protein
VLLKYLNFAYRASSPPSGSFRSLAFEERSGCSRADPGGFDSGIGSLNRAQDLLCVYNGLLGHKELETASLYREKQVLVRLWFLLCVVRGNVFPYRAPGTEQYTETYEGG